jgi:hypothetical protein
MKQRGRKSAAHLALMKLTGSKPPAPPAFEPPQPPSHLGAPERLIWDGVLAEFALNTTAEIAILQASLEAHMRARLAREAVAMDGMTTAGRDGQPRVNPLLAVERDARSAFLTGLKQLKLIDIEPESGRRPQGGFGITWQQLEEDN